MKYLNEEFIPMNICLVLKSLIKHFWSEKYEFYSSLRGKEISDKEYQHVLKVWNIFQTPF